MPELHGRATFPGIQQVLSCSYVLSHGISPGVATLEIVPQSNFIAAGGSLVLFDGAVRLEFPRCKVDQSTVGLNAGGFITSLAIFDRRWAWAFGGLSGSYNLTSADGTYDKRRLKTPQQLATLCLQQLGETGFDVSEMPNDSLPLVEWDHENPAEALADLAQKMGCRVVLRLDGRVKLARTGSGTQLPRPRQDILEDSLTINPPERPDGILFSGGPTRFQVDFVLEAVGEDVDGKIKPIFDLSYKPAGGWSGVVPPFFGQVSKIPVGILDRIPRDLAKATVFRWYRIDNRDVGDLRKNILIPGYGRIDILDQILPIEDELVQTFIDVENGQPKNFPAEVEGTFYDGKFGDENRVHATYTDDFTIDRELGIVKFSGYVGQLNPITGNYLAADLILRTACSVRNSVTWALQRFERLFVFPGPRFGTGAQQIKQDDLQLTLYPTYNAANKVMRITTNEKEMIRQADFEIAAAALAYQTPLPQEIAYAGLKAISPDGAIQQVAWSVGSGGCTTRASRNDEFSVVTPSYQERRALERLRGDFLQQLQKQLARQRQERRARKEARGK